MDFGKYKYELAKREKQAKKKQHSFQLKEMRYRPKIDEHDYQFKTRHVREFLISGSKVRAMVFFRGREMSRLEYGKKVLERLELDLKEIAVVDSPARMEGRNMSMVLSPKPDVVKKAQLAKAESQDKKELETADVEADGLESSESSAE